VLHFDISVDSTNDPRVLFAYSDYNQAFAQQKRRRHISNDAFVKDAVYCTEVETFLIQDLEDEKVNTSKLPHEIEKY
jgi:hypothetical protein